MTNQQLLDKVIDMFDGTVVDDGIESYPTPGKDYNTQYNNQRREWSCSCPHYMFRARKRGLDCKHIKAGKRKKFELLIK
tara:strand:+ start:3059 stop:3295 length:237 start_codon:yes stop_codon:yes gene_type:complete